MLFLNALGNIIKKYDRFRLTVTNVVFEFINISFVILYIYWLTVTNVVFELNNVVFFH